MPDLPVLENIREFLTAEQVAYREVHHQPTYTSEESARARGEEIRIGGKALLLKVGENFRLFVLPANCKADSAAIRNELGVRKTRFATRDELLELTGLVPGCVPPFGHPILPFDLYIDSGIERNDKIAFNAGSLTDSIILATADYLRIARPAKNFAFAAQ
jgi:Ala-tRNA(Pro) deacylase